MILRNLHWWWDMWIIPRSWSFSQGVDCGTKPGSEWLFCGSSWSESGRLKNPSGNGKPNMKVDSCFPWTKRGKPPASQPAGIDEKSCKVDLIPRNSTICRFTGRGTTFRPFFPSLFPLLQKARFDWLKFGKDWQRKGCIEKNLFPRPKCTATGATKKTTGFLPGLVGV